MNEDRIKAFLQRADQDPALNNQVTEILVGPTEQIPEKLAQISATSETPFTADEFRASFKEKKLSDAELADIAGGGPGMRMKRTIDRNETRSPCQIILDKYN